MPLDDDLARRLHRDFTDSLDEELELELDDDRLDEVSDPKRGKKVDPASAVQA